VIFSYCQWKKNGIISVNSKLYWANFIKCVESEGARAAGTDFSRIAGNKEFLQSRLCKFGATRISYQDLAGRGVLLLGMHPEDHPHVAPGPYINIHSYPETRMERIKRSCLFPFSYLVCATLSIEFHNCCGIFIFFIFNFLTQIKVILYVADFPEKPSWISEIRMRTLHLQRFVASGSKFGRRQSALTFF
jgi:hypothetical protein